MDHDRIEPWIRRFLAVFLVGGLAALAYLILSPFLASIAWAAVIAHVTWPIYLRVQKMMTGRPNLSALAAVIGFAVVLVFPLLWLLVLLEQELVAWLHILSPYFTQGAKPPADFVDGLPWIGNWLQNWLNALFADPEGPTQLVTQWIKRGSGLLPSAVGGLGRNLGKFAFALITLFVFYRDGERILQQIRHVLHVVWGERIDTYLRTASNTSRAIVLSVVVAALLQGVVAAFGYWIFGVEAPVVLGVATAIASVIPFFGTGLVWVGVSIGLLMQGHPWLAAGMATWGALLIHPVDNILRPMLISNATKTPFLVTMFGVLGGLSAFGLIGLFLGPVILATTIAIWNEWVLSMKTEEIPR